MLRVVLPEMVAFFVDDNVWCSIYLRVVWRGASEAPFEALARRSPIRGPGRSGRFIFRFFRSRQSREAGSIRLLSHNIITGSNRPLDPLRSPALGVVASVTVSRRYGV